MTIKVLKLSDCYKVNHYNRFYVNAKSPVASQMPQDFYKKLTVSRSKDLNELSSNSLSCHFNRYYMFFHCILLKKCHALNQGIYIASCGLILKNFHDLCIL